MGEAAILNMYPGHSVNVEAGPVVPSQFTCPISLELMMDPVTLQTGQTFERGSIQRWFRAGKRTCPTTRQELASSELIPNVTLKNYIRGWQDTSTTTTTTTTTTTSLPATNTTTTSTTTTTTTSGRHHSSKVPTSPRLLTDQHVKRLLDDVRAGTDRVETLKLLRNMAKATERNRKMIVDGGALPLLGSIFSSHCQCHCHSHSHSHSLPNSHSQSHSQTHSQCSSLCSCGTHDHQHEDNDVDVVVDNNETEENVIEADDDDEDDDDDDEESFYYATTTTSSIATRRSISSSSSSGGSSCRNGSDDSRSRSRGRRRRCRSSPPRDSDSELESACEEALGVLAALASNEDVKQAVGQAVGLKNLYILALFLRKKQKNALELDAKMNAVIVLECLVLDDDALPEVAAVNGLVQGVVGMLKEDSDVTAPRAVTAGLRSLYAICLPKKNRPKVIQAGAVAGLLELLPGARRTVLEGAMAILDLLSRCSQGREELCDNPLSIPLVVRFILSRSRSVTEHAVRVLHSMLMFTANPLLHALAVKQGVFRQLLLVLQSGCELATKQRAQEILKFLQITRASDPCIVSTISYTIRS